MKFLPVFFLLFSISISLVHAQSSAWFKGAWYGERTFTNARVALKTPVRMEIDAIKGSLFEGRFIYMYPSDTTARLIRKIDGKIYSKYVIITKSVETYLMDPRSRSFWSDCSQCPGASSFYIENGNLILKITASNCGDTCNGETTFRRKLYTYDSVTQVAIINQLNLNKTFPKFKPFTRKSDSAATAAYKAKRDSLKYFPVLLRDGMGINFNPARYVINKEPSVSTFITGAIPKPMVINDTTVANNSSEVKTEPALPPADKKVLTDSMAKQQVAVKPASAKKDRPKPAKDSVLVKQAAIPVSLPVAPKDTFATPAKTKDTMPLAITQRVTSLITTYQVSSPHITVQLFDDGQIDGDAVSVYYNGQLIVSNRTLTHKAVTFKIEATAASRHHEFTLISESVGFMAPNTALLRITAGSQQFELTVSSSMERNAKITIDYTGD